MEKVIKKVVLLLGLSLIYFSSFGIRSKSGSFRFVDFILIFRVFCIGLHPIFN